MTETTVEFDVQEYIDNGYAENDDQMMTQEDRAVIKELHRKVDKALECIEKANKDIANVTRIAERGVEISEQNLRTLRGHNGNEGVLTRLALIEQRQQNGIQAAEIMDDFSAKTLENMNEKTIRAISDGTSASYAELKKLIEESLEDKDDDNDVEKGIQQFIGKHAVTIIVGLLSTGVAGLIGFFIAQAIMTP